MTIDILDASNYFKGLLLLIRQDHKITPAEAATMREIGRSLGLEPRFCEEAIRDVLDNPYITDTPPKFSSDDLAKRFVCDGLRLALADAEIHQLEEEWLAAVAGANGIADEWFLDKNNENSHNVSSSVSHTLAFRLYHLPTDQLSGFLKHPGPVEFRYRTTAYFGRLTEPGSK